MSEFSFKIQQKKDVNGKQIVVDEQTISLVNSLSEISIGKNLGKDNAPICKICYIENAEGVKKPYLTIDKKSEILTELLKYDALTDENVAFLPLKNVKMLSNEQITFELENETSFGTIKISGNEISQINNGSQKSLYASNKCFDVDLPKNFVDLIVGQNPLLQIRKSPSSKKFALPTQMFEMFKTLQAETKNVKILELNEIGKRKQTLKLAVIDNKILIADGSELKEVSAGFKILPDKDEQHKTTNAKDLVIRFDTSTTKIGETTNSKLIDGLTEENINEIVTFLNNNVAKDKLKIEVEEKNDIESLQIEAIKLLAKPRDKFAIIKDIANTQDTPTDATTMDATATSTDSIPESKVTTDGDSTENKIIPSSDDDSSNADPTPEIEEATSPEEEPENAPNSESSSNNNTKEESSENSASESENKEEASSPATNANNANQSPKEEDNKKQKKEINTKPYEKDVKLGKYIFPSIGILASVLLLVFAPFIGISIAFPITFGALGLVGSSIKVSDYIVKDLATIKKRNESVKAIKSKIAKKEKEQNNAKTNDKTQESTISNAKDNFFDKKEPKGEKLEKQIIQDEENQKLRKELFTMKQIVENLENYVALYKTSNNEEKKQTATEASEAIVEIKQYGKLLQNRIKDKNSQSLTEIQSKKKSIFEKFTATFNKTINKDLDKGL